MPSRGSAFLATVRACSDLAVPMVIWLCIAHALWSAPLAINHDVALNLSLAQRILDGQTPYVDFVEINPPLMMYLHIPPIVIGEVLGVHSIVVFNLLTLALCIWSTLSIRRTLIALELPGRGIVLAAWAYLAWLVHSDGDFGQREQHFVLAYVPFLLLRAARWSDRPIPARRAVALGVLAGLMTALKPQFVLAAIVTELVWLARQRRAAPLKAPESLAALGVGCAYLLHFLVMPSVAAAYLDVLPDLMHGYSALKATWTQLLDPHLVALPAAAICVAMVGRSVEAREPASEVRIGLVVFTTAAFAFIYIWPRVTFPYHFEPARHGSFLLVALMVAGPSHRMPRALVAVVGVATLVFAISVILRSREGGGGLPPRTQKLAEYIESRTKPGDSVMWLNCSVPPTYPLLVQIDRRNASRYSFLAVIIGGFSPPKVDENGRLLVAELGPAEKRFLANVRDDMERERPDVLIVSRQCIWPVPWFLEQAGLMKDVFGDFVEVDASSWGGSLAPFALFERTRR